MVPKEKKTEETPKVVKLNFVVKNYGDYLPKAKELLTKQGNVNGMTQPFDVAISLLYAENEVIGTVQKSGETRYVCKA